MHSIAMPSTPVFLTISSFIASPTPCYLLLPLTMLQPPLKKNAVSRCRNYGSSAPFGLLQSNDVTTLCSTGSLQGVDEADTIDAVDRYCANVERAERELLQPRPRPGGLVFLAGGLPLRPLPPSLFSSKCPSPFTQSRCSYPGSCLPSSDVLGAAISPRLDFSIVNTIAYSRVLSEHSSSPRFGAHVFRGGGVPTLLPQARLPRETNFLCWDLSPSVDAVGRLALSASTSSRINRCHEVTLIYARTLYLGRLDCRLAERSSEIPKRGKKKSIGYSAIAQQ